MSNPIQTILFDLGGVLIELSGIPTMVNWTNNILTPDQLWAQWLESPAVRAFETGRISPTHFAEQLIDEMSLPVEPEAFISTFTQWPKGLFPGTIPFIQSIPSQYTVAALSNTNTLHWPRFMGEMGLDGLFQHTFASHLIGELKPDPAVFEHVLNTLGCSPSSVLFLDDNQLNVDAAQTLGFQAIVVQGLQEAQQTLVDFNIFPSLDKTTCP